MVSSLQGSLTPTYSRPSLSVQLPWVLVLSYPVILRLFAPSSLKPVTLQLLQPLRIFLLRLLCYLRLHVLDQESGVLLFPDQCIKVWGIVPGLAFRLFYCLSIELGFTEFVSLSSCSRRGEARLDALLLFRRRLPPWVL